MPFASSAAQKYRISGEQAGSEREKEEEMDRGSFRNIQAA